MAHTKESLTPRKVSVQSFDPVVCHTTIDHQNLFQPESKIAITLKSKKALVAKKERERPKWT